MFSKRLPNKASIFSAELEVIVFVLCYIKITVKNNKFVVLVTLNLHFVVQVRASHCSNYYEIIIFLTYCT